MKYSIDTYRLYYGEERFASSCRVRVTLKEEVDADALQRAVNTAIKRYPYFAVKVTVDEDGGYVLVPNPEPVAVLPVTKKVRNLCSKEVNEHLLFVEYEGRDIFFYISHSLCGGKGALPWIMTTMYQYVKEKYGIEPNAPGIRKPESELLEGEATEPSIEMLAKEPPVCRSKGKKPVMLAWDYLNGLFNPFVRNHNYRRYTFNQKDIIAFAKNNDASVASFFLVVTGKALDRVLPEKDRVIVGEIAHNPAADIGLPNSHCDLLSHVFIDYDREILKWDMEKLGTVTRGAIILQTDPTVSSDQLRQLYNLYEQADQISGLKNKREFLKKNNPSSGKDARHGTYIVNYTGQVDWGEVADYIESYNVIVEGHVILEILSMADKIFVSFMQMTNTKKYVNAFESVLKDLSIPFKVEGPFPKRLPKHELPLE